MDLKLGLSPSLLTILLDIYSGRTHKCLLSSCAVYYKRMKEAMVLVFSSYHRSDLPLSNIKVSWAYILEILLLP